MSTVNTLTTIFSSHSVYLERLAAQYANELDPYLKVIEQRVGALFIALPARALTAKEQAEYAQATSLIYKEELTHWTDSIKAAHKELGGYEAAFSANALESVILKEGFEAVIPSAAQIASLANKTPIKQGEGAYTTYNSMMGDFVKTTSKKADAIVRNGFAFGQTNAQITAQIMEDSGLLGKSAKTSAKAISRTGTNHYSNQARIELGRKNSDVVSGWRSLGTIDGRSSKQCSYWDQKVRKEDSPDWSKFVCPRHRNCRSILIMEVNPKYAFDDSTATRPENFKRDGKNDASSVSSKRQYYDELNKLNASDQDAALGSPTLGRAFRKMSGDKAGRDKFSRQLLDSTYQPLTIEEMTAKDNELGRILKDMNKR